MTRKRTPSEDFELGYQAGWVGRAKQGDIEVHKLTSKLALIEARLGEALKRAEAAEKARAKAEAARARAK